VVEEVPPARKSVSWNGAIAALEKAQVRVVSVAVESVCFTLVPEEASIGRET
jgi:hypothetical protein